MSNEDNRAVRPMSAPVALLLALKIMPMWLTAAALAVAALALLALTNTLYCRRPDPHQRLIAVATALRPTATGRTTAPQPGPAQNWSHLPRHRRAA
jgi:hypothetical protein